MEGRQRRKQWRAIFDSVSHQLGTQTSESWEHSHTFKWSLLFMLECNHFKCSFSATDLRSIWFKNALARDFFSWAHNFKAFPQFPCGRSLVRAGERWNQRIDNSSEILFHVRLPCLPSFHACSAPQCGRTASSWMYLHYGSVDPMFGNM